MKMNQLLPLAVFAGVTFVLSACVSPRFIPPQSTYESEGIKPNETLVFFRANCNPGWINTLMSGPIRYTYLCGTAKDFAPDVLNKAFQEQAGSFQNEAVYVKPGQIVMFTMQMGYYRRAEYRTSMQEEGVRLCPQMYVAAHPSRIYYLGDLSVERKGDAYFCRDESNQKTVDEFNAKKPATLDLVIIKKP